MEEEARESPYRTSLVLKSIAVKKTTLDTYICAYLRRCIFLSRHTHARAQRVTFLVTARECSVAYDRKILDVCKIGNHRTFVYEDK